MKFSTTPLVAILAACLSNSYAKPYEHHHHSSLRSLKKSDKEDDKDIVISRECELGKSKSNDIFLPKQPIHEPHSVFLSLSSQRSTPERKSSSNAKARTSRVYSRPKTKSSTSVPTTRRDSRSRSNMSRRSSRKLPTVHPPTPTRTSL